MTKLLWQVEEVVLCATNDAMSEIQKERNSGSGNASEVSQVCVQKACLQSTNFIDWIAQQALEVVDCAIHNALAEIYQEQSSEYEIVAEVPEVIKKKVWLECLAIHDL